MLYTQPRMLSPFLLTWKTCINYTKLFSNISCCLMLPWKMLPWKILPRKKSPIAQLYPCSTLALPQLCLVIPQRKGAKVKMTGEGGNTDLNPKVCHLLTLGQKHLLFELPYFVSKIGKTKYYLMALRRLNEIICAKHNYGQFL